MFKKVFEPKNKSNSAPSDPLATLQATVAELSRELRSLKKKRRSFLLPLILFIVGLLGISYFMGIDLRKTFSLAKNDVSNMMQNVSLPVSGNTVATQYESQITQYEYLLQSKDLHIATLEEHITNITAENTALRAQQDMNKKRYEDFLLLQNAQMLQFIAAQITTPQNMTSDLPPTEIETP